MKIVCRRCLDEGKPAALLGEREPFDNPAVFPFSPPCPEHERQFEEALSAKLGRPWHQALAEALDEHVALIVLCNPAPPRLTSRPWPSQFDAAQRLLRLRGKPPFLPPRAHQELCKLAQRWEQDHAELLDSWFQEGIVVAVSRLEMAQRIRLGRRWVRNDAGEIARLRPGDLDVQDGIKWLIAEARAYAKAKALDEPYPSSSRDALTRMAPMKEGSDEPSAQPDDPTWNIEEEMIRATLDSVLTPKQRRLLAHLIEGVDAARLPDLLNCSPATVRVHLHKLREKARQILKIPSA